MQFHTATLVLVWPLVTQAWPFDYPLQVDRPQTVKLGDEFQFTCQLSAQSVLESDTCHFITPQGLDYIANVTSGTVLDENQSEVPTLTAVTGTNEGGSCGLKGAAFEEAFVGQWSCILDGEPYHQGTFHIFADSAVPTYVSEGIRLPRHVVPSVYELELSPNIEEGQFDIPGFLRLHFEVESDGEDEADRSQIVLHTKEILIDEDSLEVMSASQQRLDVQGFEYDLEREFFVIQLVDPLELGNYSLAMKFTSYLHEDLAGFYRSSYLDPKSQEKKFLASSQFWSTDARRAFPCLDEPDLKAKFQVKLGHKAGTRAVSNMDVLKVEEDDQGRSMTEFKETQVMSTYLVAFLISELEPTSTPDKGSNITIYHVPGKSSRATLAKEVGPKILTYYQDYFSLDYPLPKLDMAALPDLSFGAMENWGLVTYREAFLLFEEGVSSRNDLDKVVELIAHELAHQWFGNLISIGWWNDLWLSEGFATYMEKLGSLWILPDNEKLDRALLDEMHTIFAYDALKSATPISAEVANPAFDLGYIRPSYAKGQSLIRMMENFLTLSTFQKGVMMYLQAHKSGNADRFDLWASLNEAAKEDQTLPGNLDVATIMETWTTREGFPVLQVDHFEGMRKIEQKRFFLDPEAQEPNWKYYVPISLSYAGGNFDTTFPTAWLNPEDESMIMHFQNYKDQPYILNVQQTAYYRVNYDLENWAKITEALHRNPKSIHKLNRAQILDDSFNLARAGQLAYSVPLAISTYLVYEDIYLPLQAGLNSLEYISQMTWDNEEEHLLFREYVKYLLRYQYEESTWNVAEDDPFLKVLKRQSVIQWMCLSGHKECIAKAQDIFQAWMADPEDKIHPDITELTYQVAIRNGQHEEFDFLFDQITKVEGDQELFKIIKGLGQSTQEAKLLELLNLTIDPQGPIRRQNHRDVYQSIGSTHLGRRVQFEWLRSNLDQVVEQHGSVDVDILKVFVQTISTQAELDEFQTFSDDHPEQMRPIASSLAPHLEQARINVKWRALHLESVLAWLTGGTYAKSFDLNYARTQRSLSNSGSSLKPLTSFLL